MSRANPRAVKITEALAHCIAPGDQPLSVAENVGFRRLLGTHSSRDMRFPRPPLHPGRYGA